MPAEHIPNKHPSSSRRKEIMLCSPFDERRLEKWNTRNMLVQPKLDGERCRAIINCETKTVDLYSSECNPIVSVPHIIEDLIHLADQSPSRILELDGELYNHDKNFELIHSIVSRKKNLHEDSEFIQFHIFDIVSTRANIVRAATLYDIFNHIAPPNNSLVRVPFVLAHNQDEILEHLSKYTNEGYEGIVIRHPIAPYERKRSLYAMKYKPHQSDIYEIVGCIEEKDKFGNPKGRLGAFVCVSNSEDQTIFSVGSGLTDQQREDYWARRDELIGYYLEVKYQSITPKHVPRFPVFISLCSP